MPQDLQHEIATLRKQIASQEKEIHNLEHECTTLERELSAFEKRYNAIIKPVANRLDAAKSALEKLRDLHLMQQLGDRTSLEALWRENDKSTQANNEYVPPHVRDYAIPEPIDILIPEPKTPKNIKSLYRKLARQFHPDLANNEDDRRRRTKLMSLINEAYQEGDFEVLKALYEQTDAQKEASPKQRINSQISLDQLTLRKLKTRFQDLAVQVRDLKEKRHNLRYGPLMELKLEDSLAKNNGEDLLSELAAEMEAEYWEMMQEVESLRQQVN
ncbi:MAG: J domain-containing protein [Chloroflexota bacterium]